MKGNPGELLMSGNVDRGVTFVISKGDVIARPVLFDKLTLKKQRLGFAMSNSDIEAMDAGNHGPLLGGNVFGLKVTGHSLFEVLCFSDVDHLSLLVKHSVNARTGGQGIKKSIKIKWGGFWHRIRYAYRGGFPQKYTSVKRIARDARGRDTKPGFLAGTTQTEALKKCMDAPGPHEARRYCVAERSRASRISFLGFLFFLMPSTVVVKQQESGCDVLTLVWVLWLA